jgi:hypothetical protein
VPFKKKYVWPGSVIQVQHSVCNGNNSFVVCFGFLFDPAGDRIGAIFTKEEVAFASQHVTHAAKPHSESKRRRYNENI